MDEPDAAPSVGHYKRLKQVIRALQFALALAAGMAVWLIGFNGGDDTVEVLPATQQAFSLDLQVIGTADHELVYAVEQRARPAYRIFSFDPSSGDIETVFTVPDDAIIFGITLSPDRSSLAVAYAEDFESGGSGVWLLDLVTDTFTEVSPVVPDVYLTELEWSEDASTLHATRIDRTGESEQLAVASISVASGAVEIETPDAISPTLVGSDLYFLTVAEDHSRRSIGRSDGNGEFTEFAVGDGTLDLDHLLPGENESTVRVAAIETEDVDESAFSIGTPASAHGNHDVPSTWWNVETATTPASSEPTDIEPIIVYDSDSRSGPIVYATLEGISITLDGKRVDLVKSRAIRFITT